MPTIMFKSVRAVALVPLLAAVFIPTAHAISKITRSGRYLYDSSGNRFYIQGVAYQQQGVVVASADNPFGEPSSFIDSLADGAGCTRDVPFLQKLGVNTIRLYSVNSSLNHDSCMSTFSAAGIYTIIDLALPLNGSIDRVSPSWSTNLLAQYTETIDAFSKYDNVLAYNVGNEVVVQNTTDISPYVKAAARDTRAYLQSKGSSALVGYAAINGDSVWRGDLASFLSCDPSGANSPSTSIDIYGLNDYERCGNSTFEASYSATTSAFSSYNVVAYFSEFGCLTTGPRPWTEVAALFGSDMNTVWSGGVAFSYFPAESVQGQFGMVSISSDGSTVTTSQDFSNLQAEYQAVTSINSPSQSSAGAPTYPACPAQSSDFDASTTLPPTPNLAACTCLENSLSCQFRPATNNYTAIVGSLLDVGCSLLGQAGGSCIDIGGNGSTGVYGRVSDCDPTVKLSFVMSEYYEANNRQASACSFAGNGTVNPLAPSSVSAANAVASSCIANPNAVFTPSSVPTSAGGAPGSTSTAKSGHTSGSVTVMGDVNALFGISLMAIVTVLGGVWTLA